MKRAAVLLFVAAMLPAPAEPQDITLGVSHLLSDPGWTSYQLGIGRPFAGPLGYSITASRTGEAGWAASLWGPGLDLTLFRGGRPGAYLTGGVAGGLATGADRSVWGSWSAGLGWELQPFHPLTLGIEGRYRSLEFGTTREGIEFGLRLGLTLGGGGTGGGGRLPSSDGTLPAPRRPLATVTGDELPDALAVPTGSTVLDGVLATATEVMGTPYKWGGTSADEGFDCSGLIQYAYSAHGVELPRRSVDQAREGLRVEKKLSALVPGDILTFSNSGNRVTHVGLYLGDGRFIHSASDGVQVSQLSADDPYGRWWYRRWVGARRIVPVP